MAAGIERRHGNRSHDGLVVRIEDFVDREDALKAARASE
jgi:hypothetical protein